MTDSVAVVIPAKPSWRSKQRLAPLLSAAQRSDFTHWLLATLLETVQASDLPLRPLVLTSDPSLAALAAPYGYPTLPDPANADLNEALEHGRAFVQAQGVESVLVLPTDLPYLTPTALRTFVAAATSTDPCVLIAPDHEGLGTNALLLRPIGAIPFRFGVNSAALHRAEAQKRGIPVVEYRDPAFAQDIDTPEHYVRLVERKGRSGTTTLPQGTYSHHNLIQPKRH